MNTPRKLAGSLTAALAVLALGGLLDAAVAASAPTPPAGPEARESHGPMHGHGHGSMHEHEMMAGGAGMEFMHALHELDLGDAQREQVHALMRTEHERMGASMESPPADFVALGNPGDPKHGAALEAAKQRAVERVQHFADIEQKVYALLTPAQQAKLPALLADMQKHLQERHAGHDGHDAPQKH